jgi:NADPH:quinone reductase-like Zn-dependent oxidoreductase
VGYITRPLLGPSYASYTTVRSDLAVKLPEGVNTQTAAAVLLQGLTALSMVKVTCEVQKGGNGGAG